jgi:formylmethanofuran dehydrogenase subunit E
MTIPGTCQTETPMPDNRLQALLAQSAALHAHLCPRQVLGVRMGLHAAGLLDLDLPQRDKRLLTIVETDGCFADGIAVATGCWLGHRTLRCVDHGKVAATFVDTRSGAAVRIHPSDGSRRRAAHYAPTAADRWHAYLEGYQVMPAPELLVAERVRLACPVEDLVSRPDHQVVCDTCHEEIFNERELVVGGRVRCRGCAGQAYVRRGAEASWCPPSGAVPGG